MTPKEAAAVIGCTANQVRHLIRAGRIKATLKDSVSYGYSYKVSRREAERYRDTQQSRGFPRGAKRTECRGPIQDNNQ